MFVGTKCISADRCSTGSVIYFVVDRQKSETTRPYRGYGSVVDTTLFHNPILNEFCNYKKEKENGDNLMLN